MFNRKSVCFSSLIICTSILATTIWMSGCSDERYGELIFPGGTGNVEVSAEAEYVSLSVFDEDRPLHQQQLLFMGRKSGTESSIVLNFDFAELSDVDFEELGIRYVKLRMIQAGTAETVGINTDTSRVFHATVHELAQPFDEADFLKAPCSVPSYNAEPLAELDMSLGHSFYLEIAVPIEKFMEWTAAGTEVGLIIRPGENHDRINQIASKEFLLSYYLLRDYSRELPFQPSLIISTEANYDKIILPSIMDASVVEQVGDIPAEFSDRFMVRTGVRQYPVLKFVIPDLPDNAVVTDVTLSVRGDSTGFGSWTPLYANQIDNSIFEHPSFELSVDQLADLSQSLGVSYGNYYEDGYYYYSDSHRHWNDSVQMTLNRNSYRLWERSLATGDQLSLALTGGEYFSKISHHYHHSEYYGGFFFSQSYYFGPAAVDSLQPRLLIKYGLQ